MPYPFQININDDVSESDDDWDAVNGVMRSATRWRNYENREFAFFTTPHRTTHQHRYQTIQILAGLVGWHWLTGLSLIKVIVLRQAVWMQNELEELLNFIFWNRHLWWRTYSGLCCDQLGLDYDYVNGSIVLLMLHSLVSLFVYLQYLCLWFTISRLNFKRLRWISWMNVVARNLTLHRYINISFETFKMGR